MPGRAKKSTKKFEKRHLSEVLDKRKEGAKIKQRQQTKVKKQKRNAADNAKVSDDGNESAPNPIMANGISNLKKVQDMSVDDFFQDGYQLPELKAKPKSKSKSKSKEAALKLGKRKREEEDDIDHDSAHEDSDMEHDAEPSSEGDGPEVHKDIMDGLAEKDPEFHEYLKENDPELLDFDEDAEFALADDLSEEESPKKKGVKGEEQQAESNSAPQAKGQIEVTIAMVKQWKTSLSEQHSQAAMQQVVLAFKAAAFINSDDVNEHKYSISNSEIYHDLLVTALEHVPRVLNHHIPAKESASGKIRVATDSKISRNLIMLLRPYCTSILHLLEHLSDAPTIKLTLNSLTLVLPYLLSLKKILRDLVKKAIDIWSDASSDEATRITSFLLVRRLATICDASLREAILRTTYQGLVKGSRITNIHTLPGINLMKNSAAELWGLDPNIGYTTGFTFIRQLAVHLRTSITQPTKESYKTIYNWQFTHSLDFWSRVLSTHCSPLTNAKLKTPSASPLHPLIYPLVQITLGALRLIPTPIYFPLRFHLTRSLLRVSRTTTTYIPLAPALLEVLSSPDLSKPPKPSTLPPLDFSIVLRAPKSYLRTRVYQDGLGQQIQELLAEFFCCWAKHISFPELTIPPTVAMKRWLKSASSVPSRGNKQAISKADRQGKGNKNAKLNSSISLLLQKLAANAEYVENHRAQVSFGPSDREGVDSFLRDVNVEETPLGAFVVGMRKQKEAKEKILEQGRREDETRRRDEKEERRKVREDEFEGDENDVEMLDEDGQLVEEEDDD